MNYNRSTVVIVHENNEKYDYDSVKNWFELSAYNACEANDLFDAIDTASDFTSASGPDVLLVCMRPGPQLDMISRSLDADGNFFEVPVAILSDGKNVDERKPYSFGSLKNLKGSLDAKPVSHAARVSTAK